VANGAIDFVVRGFVTAAVARTALLVALRPSADYFADRSADLPAA
jgi:hypothetical protein